MTREEMIKVYWPLAEERVRNRKSTYGVIAMNGPQPVDEVAKEVSELVDALLEYSNLSQRIGAA